MSENTNKIRKYCLIDRSNYQSLSTGRILLFVQYVFIFVFKQNHSSLEVQETSVIRENYIFNYLNNEVKSLIKVKVNLIL